jgi:1,4-alpha-glucan branching enzyme
VPIIFVLNFTPVPRDRYSIGVPDAGLYEKIFDSDSAEFGGSGYNRQSEFGSDDVVWHGRPARLLVNVPPLSAIAVRLKNG